MLSKKVTEQLRQNLRANYFRDQRGATAVLVAISLPILLGAAAFGAEAGFWTYRQRVLQQYADAAAFTGAVELLNSRNESAVRASVGESLENNGLRSDIGSFTAVSPPETGPFAGTTSVEVSVREEWPRFFTAIFFEGDVTIGASATAQLEASAEACMLALDPSASGAATITGTGDVTLNGCSLFSNSSASDALSVRGAGRLYADCAGAAGGVQTTSSGITLSDCPEPKENMPVVADPYADVPEPDVSGPCKKPNSFGGSPSSVYNITGGRYCGLTIQRTVNLAPGMYIVDGGELRINSTAKISGSGVTFFLTNGARLVVNGTASVNLSAPTSGTYSGLVFFGDRSGSPESHVLNGSAGSTFTGAVYFPNDDLGIRGSNSAAAGCTQFIARTLDFRGTSGASIDCDGVGVSPIQTVGGVRLVG